MEREEYKAYLQSEAWAIRRQICLDRFGGQCALCENRAWHAHHRTYDRVGRENLHDLTALCGDCHEKFHGKGKFEDVEVELMLEAKRRREERARDRKEQRKDEEQETASEATMRIFGETLGKNRKNLFNRPPRPHNTTPTPDDDAARSA